MKNADATLPDVLPLFNVKSDHSPTKLNQWFLGLSFSLLGGRVAGLPQLLNGPGHTRTRMRKTFKKVTLHLLKLLTYRQTWKKCKTFRYIFRQYILLHSTRITSHNSFKAMIIVKTSNVLNSKSNSANIITKQRQDFS